MKTCHIYFWLQRKLISKCIPLQHTQCKHRLRADVGWLEPNAYDWECVWVVYWHSSSWLLFWCSAVFLIFLNISCQFLSWLWIRSSLLIKIWCRFEQRLPSQRHLVCTYAVCAPVFNNGNGGARSIFKTVSMLCESCKLSFTNKKTGLCFTVNHNGCADLGNLLFSLLLCHRITLWTNLSNAWLVQG